MDSPAQATSTPLFKKKKPQARVRDLQAGSDDEGGGNLTGPDSPGEPGAGVSPAGSLFSRKNLKGAGGSAAKGKLLKKKSSSRLSFGGDGDDEESSPGSFVPKKSLLSQSLTGSMRASSLASSLPPSHLDSSPAPALSQSYSKEYLNQLKAATPNTPSSLSDNRRSRLNQQDVSMDVDDEVTWDNGRTTSEMYGDLTLDDISSADIILPDEDDLAIPTQSHIASIKARREEMKKMGAGGGGDDFISLSNGGGTMVIRDQDQWSGGGPHPSSRVVREEDETGEGDDEHAEFTGALERIPLGKKANRDAAKKLKGEIVDMIVDAEDEDDEETREWEDAQVRRAELQSRRRGEQEQVVKKKKAYVPAPIPATAPLPTLAAASKRLATAVSALQLSHKEHAFRIEAVQKDVGSLDEQENDLRNEVERVEKKREWAEEFRGWIEMLGSFLEEKFPELEKVEEENLSLIKERFAMVNIRRTNDDSDDLSLCVGIPSSSTSSYDAEETMDELGRVVRRDGLEESGARSGVRRARRNDRETRRSLRKQQKQLSSSTKPEEDEGFSTDSSLSPADSKDYSVARASLHQEFLAIMSDVKAEDFRNPRKGLVVKFTSWREKYGEDYRNAFGGLGMVQAWDFWARLEMAEWDPLRSSTTVDSFDFQAALYSYSRPPLPKDPESMAGGDDEDVETPLGSDGDLVAAIISSTVIPRLVKLFESGVYDPYSSAQTRKTVDLVEQVEMSLGGSGAAKFQTLLKSIFTLLFNTISARLTLVSQSSSGLPPPSGDPTSIYARIRFLNRSLKLLKNILQWRMFNQTTVSELVNDLAQGVVLSVAETGWNEGGKDVAAKVSAVVPKGVLREEVANRLISGPPTGW